MSEEGAAVIPFSQQQALPFGGGGANQAPTALQAAAEIRSAASVLIERMQFFRMHGISFNGQRDMYEVLGYDRNISPTQYRERYARGGIAARIVEAFPKATWRGGAELIEDEDPETNTPFEQQWKDLDARLKIWSTLLKTDILAGQGRYAVLLIGAPGELDTELPKGRGNPNTLLYLTPFSEEDARIQEWETSAQSERFGLPRSYMLTRLSANRYTSAAGTPGFSSNDLNKPVHWSRIIHIAENALDNAVFGQPSLERVWNLLDDLDKVTGGGAEAFWLRANQGLQLDVNKDVKMDEPERQRLREQADEYANQIRRMLTTRGVKANTLGSDVANFSNPADAIITQIAGAKAIPKRILTGSEMGELASSQDRDNWKDQVNGRQTGHAGPYVVEPLVQRLINYNYLIKPKKFEVIWPHIEVMTESEKAEGASKWASTATAEGPVFNRDEIRDKWYGMKPIPKPAADAAGNPISPEGGVPLNPKVDPETGLPIQKESIDPETGQPVVQQPAAGKRVLPFMPKAAEGHYDLAVLMDALEQAIANGDGREVDRLLGINLVGEEEPPPINIDALEAALLDDNIPAAQALIDAAME